MQEFSKIYFIFLTVIVYCSDCHCACACVYLGSPCNTSIVHNIGHPLKTKFKFKFNRPAP